ncbi:MAG: stage III sporulation protein AF [Clostridium sp.]|uniref:stage III sporulation protein AF n=1 Tax=Clostridium sp. TaxID=1506 RepID=UPI003F3E7B4D
MEIIKEFVITLVSTIVLITAVELILPDNSMKKYSKFILGTMLIGVILTPIVKFLTNGEDAIIQTIVSYDNKNIKEEKDKNKVNDVNNMKKEAFEKNLSKNVDSILEKEFDEYKFSNEIECEVDFEKIEFNIKSIVVYVRDGGDVKKIKEVEKVTIDKKSEVKTDKKYENIRKYLSKELDIKEEKIKVVDEGGV